jgi:hypothetical protein
MHQPEIERNNISKGIEDGVWNGNYGIGDDSTGFIYPDTQS